nr:MAG TPA: tail tube protein [Caudoviricetes sp.]
MGENLGKKMLGMGTELIKKKSGAEQADWKVGSLISIGEVKQEASEIDITTLDSPDGAKEFMAGDTAVSDLTISGKIKAKNDEANIEKMQELFKTGKVEDWTIKFPSTAKWEFKAFIKGFSTKEATTEGVIEFEATMKISGKPTYTKSV